jgi:hypothetical protein
MHFPHARFPKVWYEIPKRPAGGLASLLEIYVPKGKQPTLPASLIADLERQLRRPEGFASYQAMRVWLIKTHQITIKAKTLQKFVRRRFGARPKVARPRDIKKS